MSVHPRVPVERALKVSGPISAEEAEVILEIAYLTIAADGALHDEEIEALARIARALSGLTDTEQAARGIGPRLDRFAEALARDGMDERVHALAEKLTRPEAKALAYRASCAIALADLDTDDREFELDLALISELDLSQEEADRLAGEVREALIVGEGEG